MAPKAATSAQKAEAPKAEAPKAEAPKAEAPKAKAPKAKENAAEDKAQDRVQLQVVKGLPFDDSAKPGHRKAQDRVQLQFVKGLPFDDSAKPGHRKESSKTTGMDNFGLDQEGRLKPSGDMTFLSQHKRAFVCYAMKTPIRSPMRSWFDTSMDPGPGSHETNVTSFCSRPCSNI